MTAIEILIKAGQLLLSLSILIVLHEAGHFISAKIFKMKVEKFYLFFDPWFSLFKLKKGETEYGIGWIPLGGYVKISGMIDESMDKEQMKLPPQPWEFRAKPPWQRLIVMIAGVTVNLLLGFLIYAMILFTWGESYLPAQNVKYGIAADSLAQSIGLHDGDKVIAVGHNPIEKFSEIPGAIILNEAKSIQVIRNGKEKSIPIPPGFIHSMITEKDQHLLTPRFPFIIGDFTKGSGGRKAGMKTHDRIISVNGTPTPFANEFSDKLSEKANQQVDIGVLRKGDTLHFKPTLSANSKLGVYSTDMTSFFDFKTKKYSFFAAIPAGFNECIDKLVSYIQQIKLIFVSKEVKASESLGGFISIGNLFPGYWDWQDFWSLTAFLSIILAVMNLLPIPALDGGHVLFLLYEIITRRKPSEKFLEYAQIAGMVLLFSLVLYANGLDIWRSIFGK